MRVNEVAKELGKTNKEVVDILQKNNDEVKISRTNASGEQAAAEKKETAEKKEAAVKPEAGEAKNCGRIPSAEQQPEGTSGAGKAPGPETGETGRRRNAGTSHNRVHAVRRTGKASAERFPGPKDIAGSGE